MSGLTSKHLVVLGNSAAGLNAIDVYRARCPEAPITVVDAEDRPAYSRVLTTYYLGGKVSEAGLFLRSRDDYAASRISTRLGRRAIAIDTTSQRVALDSGEQLPYDELLIATGAAAVRPPIPGIRLPGVFTLRNLEDARRIRDRAQVSRRVVLLGAGLVSLESLSALYHPDKQFDLVLGSDRLLSQALDPESAALLEQNLSAHNVTIHKGQRVSEIVAGAGDRLQVELASGPSLSAELVIVGKGIRPNIAALAGTPVHTDGGIPVNARMQTNVAHVSAAGDVALPRDRVTGRPTSHGIWPEAVDQGRVAGSNLAGTRLLHGGGLRLNATHLLGQAIAIAGDVEAPHVAETTFHTDPRRGRYRKIAFDDQGRILGAVLLGACADIGLIKGLIRIGRPVPALKDALARAPLSYRQIAAHR